MPKLSEVLQEKPKLRLSEVLSEDKIIPEIRAPRAPLNLKPMTIQEQAQAQNIGAISRMSGERLSKVAKQYEGRTAETGLRRTFDIGMLRDPTSKQLLEGMTNIPIKAGIMASLATTPIATLKALPLALGTFMGLDWLAEKGISKLPEKTP